MIGIIFIGDLYVCPYLHRYTEACEAQNVDYEVLFWNRCGEKLSIPSNYIAFNLQSEEEQRFITKSIDFLKYRIWLKKQIKKKKYDKLILLSTLSGIILIDLLKKYKQKYIFDIRDYSYEKFKLFYKLEKRIIDNSAYTAISSPGFKAFLPPYNYAIIHNMQSKETCFRGEFKMKSYGEPLNVVWNGTMRYFKHQSQIIQRLANDPRFNLYYHGSGPELEQYKSFVKENSIKNIFFTGRYDNTQKASLLATADLLNNSYWIDNTNEVLYAVSNRYYDGLIYRIPQLLEADTYKAKLCEDNGIGIGIDTSDDNFANRLYEWYFQIDANQFEKNCQKLLDKAIEDDIKVTGKLIEFLQKKGNEHE